MKMRTFIFLILFVYGLLYEATKRTLDDLSCAQHDELRKDCGWSGITQEQCEERNCCFGQPYRDGLPWCFMGIDDVPTYYTLGSGLSCSIDRENRRECGYKGIGKQECEERDCCYKIDDYESDIPWCFYGYQDEKIVYLEERVVYTVTNE